MTCCSGTWSVQQITGGKICLKCENVLFFVPIYSCATQWISCILFMKTLLPFAQLLLSVSLSLSVFFLFKQAHTKRQKNNVLSHQQAPYDHQFVCKAPWGDCCRDSALVKSAWFDTKIIQKAKSSLLYLGKKSFTLLGFINSLWALSIK